MLSGSASVALYAFLDLPEALLVLRPSCRGLALAARGHPRLRGALYIDVQDIEDLLRLRKGAKAPARQAVAAANPSQEILNKVRT